MNGYRALREGAGIGAVAPRRAIGVSGKDRAAFLQGLLTNDIETLIGGRGCYAAWLTPQGRMLTDLHVLESGDMTLLDVPVHLVLSTLQRLDQFLFSEDVQFADLAEALRSVWLHGPAAPDVLLGVLTGLTDPGSWRQYQNARAKFNGAPVVVARIDQLGVPGFCMYVEPSRDEDLRRALEAAGAVPASHVEVEAARIEAGYPVFGVDMDEDTIPLEAGIEDRAISLNKGCYVGQEVIIRVLHRGGGRVARRLVGLRCERSMSEGAAIFGGGKEIGTVTSAATSPERGPIALGYVKRDFAEPGTAVVVDGVAAEVTSRPMQGAR
jgi:folate-binding protein YgfZ